MRPEDFSPGNVTFTATTVTISGTRFNEAGGFLPRKPGAYRMGWCYRSQASMRPEDFSPGNSHQHQARTSDKPQSFNEAGGFLPRKLCSSPTCIPTTAAGFNEAGGFLPRKRTPSNSRQGVE